jgi:hypothetical protein
MVASTQTLWLTDYDPCFFGVVFQPEVQNAW